MSRKKILVTGANGQLGHCFRSASEKIQELDFDFKASSELDITSTIALEETLARKTYDYVINCTAYTNVEKAETHRKKAFLINAESVKNLAKLCQKNGNTLFHFSTDYVFEGNAKTPYSETAIANPINVYGASKWEGEKYIAQEMTNYFIFRTSWLYSEFGYNFYKTILKKSKEKDPTLQITTEQTGTPTNANDLAKMVIQLILQENKNYGLYHYSNAGEATWYDFAKAILIHAGKLKTVTLKKSGFYKTEAKRPIYSVLSKEKFKKNLDIKLVPWQESLREMQLKGHNSLL